MPTDLIALAERVEALGGPDRDLDRDIMAVGHEWKQRVLTKGSRVRSWCWVDRITDRWRTTSKTGFEFTASLDAAMTLVPEGWSARVFTGDPTRTLPTGGTTENARPSAEVEEHAFRNGDLSAARWCSSKAATPALALTAACLRARATTPTRTIQEDPTNGR